MHKSLFFLFFSVFFVKNAQAQADSTRNLTFSGYVETYFAYDFSKPENGDRPAFLYSYGRHKEVNLNLGFVKAAFSNASSRANLALMAGTYTNANLSSEPGTLKNVFEANGGIKLSKKRDLWLDMGVFGSHIGFESAIGKDCWSLTRSIAAENSPYYESGAKITHTTKDGKWLLSALVLNGWQRIYRPDTGMSLAMGTQIQWKPKGGKITLNSSTYWDENRFFHDFYGIFQVNELFGVTLGVDNGVQKEGDTARKWGTAQAVFRLTPSPKWAFAARVEYYQDKKGVIISLSPNRPFDASGFSFNMDYKIRENALWRIEWRRIDNKDRIFVSGIDLLKSNAAVTTSVCVGF